MNSKVCKITFFSGELENEFEEIVEIYELLKLSNNKFEHSKNEY
jgi:hypothetical protein